MTKRATEHTDQAPDRPHPAATAQDADPGTERRFDWLSEFLARLHDEHVLIRHGSAGDLAPAHLLEVDPEDWGRIAQQAAAFGCRWAGLWGDQREDTFRLSACLEYRGDHVILRAEVPLATPVLASHTPHYPAADRIERHTQDLLGIAFADHPDTRPWTRHRAWPDTDFPLRRSFPAAGTGAGETPPDSDYRFLKASGSGVHEVPVGPVHAGIIEPGHFRFQAVGETVLNLEERLGYAHKGIEKIAEGRDAQGLARLAGRVSGDSTVAHTWAACMAMERATRLPVPARAACLRALMAERERIANHLGDIGAICNDVAFAFAYQQFGRLRERWQRVNGTLFGHRLMMDCVVPGGVRDDLTDEGIAMLREQCGELRRELPELLEIMDNNPSLQERLAGTGTLTPELAVAFGTLGYVGRASACGFDLRRDSPYAPYDRLTVAVPACEEGDVAARLRVRADEIPASLDLIEDLLQRLPDGDIRTAWRPPAQPVEGLGLVEGWRGEIITYVRLAADGRVRRFFPRDPSWMNWPALEKLMRDNIVPDFPVCNKSVNGSYSGHDL